MIWYKTYFVFIWVLFILLPATGCQGQPKQSVDDIETGSMLLPAGQEFEVVEYSAVAVEKSLAKGIIKGSFLDSNGDGIADSVLWGEDEIRGDVRRENIKGYAYNDGRYVVFYPSELKAFDDKFLNIALAIIVKQRQDDASKKGLQVAFIDDSGKRAANPAYGFFPKSDIEALPSYTRWTQSGLDFAIAADPEVPQFFIILKDFALPDEIFVIAFKWY
jgi:hypothetical protein